MENKSAKHREKGYDEFHNTYIPPIPPVYTYPSVPSVGVLPLRPTVCHPYSVLFTSGHVFRKLFIGYASNYHRPSIPNFLKE